MSIGGCVSIMNNTQQNVIETKQLAPFGIVAILWFSLITRKNKSVSS
jgi:hypothetical protein